MAKWHRNIGGVVLLLVAAVGLCQSVRGLVAQTLYFRAKFSRPLPALESTRQACRVAHWLYPYNYYFCLWTGEKAYEASQQTTGEAALELTAVAEQWCDRGLILNPYRSQLVSLKTKLLAERDIDAAIEVWSKYIDWDYWDPNHHAVLAGLQAQAGDFQAAMQTLDMAKGSSHYEAARSEVRAAWKREMMQ